MAEIVDGKFDEHLANGESVDIGNGYQIKSRFHELETYGYDTGINKLSAGNVFIDIDEIPQGKSILTDIDGSEKGDVFGYMETRIGNIGFNVKNAHNMLAKHGVPHEKREEAIGRYFNEAKEYFLGNFSYVDPKLVIVAPDGEEIIPYSDVEPTVLRSDDKEAILAEQNTGLKFIEENLVTILSNHYENEIEEAEKIVNAAESKLAKVVSGQKNFHFGDDNSPNGPGM